MITVPRTMSPSLTLFALETLFEQRRKRVWVCECLTGPSTSTIFKTVAPCSLGLTNPQDATQNAASCRVTCRPHASEGAVVTAQGVVCQPELLADTRTLHGAGSAIIVPVWDRTNKMLRPSKLLKLQELMNRRQWGWRLIASSRRKLDRTSTERRLNSGGQNQ